MLRTLAAQTPELHNQQVMLEGWIHRRRRLAAITFVVLRDRSGLAQVVVTDEQARRMVDGLGVETVIRVVGKVVANDKAPDGTELIDPAITVLAKPASPPPVELWRPKLDMSLPVLLDNAPIA